MGVSLQSYRISIGTFCSSQVQGRFRNIIKSRNFNSSTNQKLIFRLLVLLSLFIAQSPNYRSITNYQSSSTTNLKTLLISSVRPLVKTECTILHDESFRKCRSENAWDPQFIVIKKISLLTDVNFYARYTHGNRTNRGLKICHWNMGSAHLQNKLNEIETVIADLRPHVLGISESNLYKKHDLENVMIEDYELFTATTLENPNLEVSRVVVYKHKSIVAKLRKDLMDDTFSSIWMEMGLPHKRKILVCNFYREHQYLKQADNSSLAPNEQLIRWLVFLDQWERALATGKECLVLGDSNIDHSLFNTSDISKSRHKPLVTELCDRIFPHGVKQCLTGFTHSRPGQRDSLLDVLYTNAPQKMSNIQAVTRGASDHKIVTAVRHCKNVVTAARYTKKRSYKNFDQELFLHEIRKTSWWDIYNSADVDEATELFTQKLTNILDKMVPMKIYQTRRKFVPWLSEETRKLMKERDDLHNLAKSSREGRDWENYKKTRNKVTGRLKSEKENWQKKTLDNCNNDSGKLWKNILGWLKWSSSGAPTKLFNNGTFETSPKRLASIMNNFYIDKIRRIRENLPPITGDPLKKLKTMMKDNRSIFKLLPVHPDLVEKIITELRNSKSSGLDNIDTYILKLIKPEIVPAVTHIINLSIKSTTFPRSWKYSKIVPLLKKDDPLEPKNYRPVALIPIVSKVLERVIFMQMVHYMETNSLFHPSHHGYRASHNTCTALIELYDSWVEALERGELSGVCLVDLSAAFDCVDHSLLLKKMEVMGFDSKAVDWSRSYLANRQQCVIIDGSLSEFLSVEVGVPQGSILGPLFYLLYTNDLPEVLHKDTCDYNQLRVNRFNTMCPECGGLVAFADDSTITLTDSNPETLTQKLTENYNIVADYFSNNRLKVNDDKTHLLVMTTSQKRQHLSIDIQINTPTEVVTASSSERLLGIQIHENMKWRDYIIDTENSLLKSLNTRIKALKRIKHVASFKSRLMVANGIFSSKLLYGLQLYGGTEEYLLNSLQVVQNMAARTVTKLNMFTPTSTLLKQTGWLSVRQLIFYHSVLLVYKVRQTSLPQYLADKIQNEYSYDTRISRTNLVKWGTQFKATRSLTKNSWR